MQKLIPILFFMALSGCYDPKDNCFDDTGAKIGAFVASQHFVERELRSPSTADFPNYSSEGVSVIFKRECHFSVIGYVDAQNGFGATIRSLYYIDIEADPKDGGYMGRNLLIQ